MTNKMNYNYWHDWEYQMKNAIYDISSIISLDGSNLNNLNHKFHFMITPYLYSIMDEKNMDCPIKKQFVPTLNELNCSKLDSPYYNHLDPLCETKFVKFENIVHRYPDRVLIIATSRCFSYCRFCSRKRIMSENNSLNLNLHNIIEYISSNTKIRDVLISGGDPLTLPDNELEYLISSIRSIQHVEIIRIGTRAPSVLPMRITDSLVAMLKKYHPIWINTHFNHPNELSQLALDACERIVNAGIPSPVFNGLSRM